MVKRLFLLACLSVGVMQARADTSFVFAALAGASQSEVKLLLEGGDGVVANTSDKKWAAFLGASVHGVFDDHELGVTLSYSKADGDNLLAIRPLDYRYQLFPNIYLKGFFGIARYDKETAAHGYILGGGAEWRLLDDQIGIHLEGAYGDKIARDRVLPDDPPAIAPDSPEIFYDMVLINTYVSWYF